MQELQCIYIKLLKISDFIDKEKFIKNYIKILNEIY